MKEVYGTMALDNTRLYTTKDIMELPDGVRAELIDGEIFYMACPNRTHQSLIGELYYVLRQYQKEHSGKCKTFIAPFAVFINRDEYNYLVPDLMIFCPHGEEDDRLQNDGIHGAPDFVLEVVSPSSKKMDYYKKAAKYEASHVREYWIVDPDAQRITVHFYEKDAIPVQYTFQDTVPVGIYDGFSIDFRKLTQQIMLQ